MERCRRAFTSSEYWIRCWVEDGLRDRDPKKLGKIAILILGGGFTLIPRALGDSVDDISGAFTTIRVWRLRDADISLLAIGGGSWYVEAALAMLCQSPVERIYALGWCGSVKKDVDIGNIVVAYAAIRGDAASPRYVPLEYPATSDPIDAVDLFRYLKSKGFRTHLGYVYTTSSHMREREILEQWKDLACCIEGEVATLYTIASLLRIPATAALVVSDSLLEERRDPRKTASVTNSLLKAITDFALSKLRSPSSYGTPQRG